MYVAETKALISFAVTAKLICVFVFAYAKCWFSHDAYKLTSVSLTDQVSLKRKNSKDGRHFKQVKQLFHTKIKTPYNSYMYIPSVNTQDV